MGYRSRVILTILSSLAAYLLSALTVAAQSAQRKDAPAGIERQGQASGDHGLVLILGLDTTPESTESPALKTCLAHNPPPACVPLTLTIKNEGKETILSWFHTCGQAVALFDLRQPDGTWMAFPMDLANMWACSSNMMGVESLLPGASRTSRFRLADESLMLGTSFPRTGDPEAWHRGYAVLGGPGPYTLRAHWNVDGCTASEKVDRDSQLDPSGAPLCAKGSERQPHFLVIQSNEVTLPSASRN
ncbi:MAG: hypothetical protein HY010_20885 [Acidobacteria bacterium]|nr:hypothetical protein [Acidobacteriota bacterium]